MRIKGKKQRSKTEKEYHYKEMTERYLRGESIYKIAEALSVHFTTVSKDLQHIRAMWREQYLADFDAAKARELAKLDNLELEAWNAYERSQQNSEAKSQTIETVNLGKDGEGPEVGRQVKLSSKTAKRDGSAVYLEIIMRCIETRCKILGAFAPVVTQSRAVVSNSDGSLMGIAETSSVQIYLPSNNRDSTSNDNNVIEGDLA